MSFDVNPRDDEQDEEELLVYAIAELIQEQKTSQAKLHLRAYIKKEIQKQKQELT